MLTHQLHLMPARTSGGVRVDGGLHVQRVFTNVAWLNDGAAAECGREIQINILVHIINAPPTSSPLLLTKSKYSLKNLCRTRDARFGVHYCLEILSE